MNLMRGVMEPLAILVLGTGALAYMLTPIVRAWRHRRADDDEEDALSTTCVQVPVR